MIIKKIHYCWFGKNPLTETAKKCIESWHKLLPDFKIIRWDESNYDISKNPFTKKAYESKKFAFVSDFARFEILLKHGGVFLDTDVEMLKTIRPLLSKGPFMGLEGGTIEEFSKSSIKKLNYSSFVAPGLIIYANKNMKSILDILNIYKKIDFLDDPNYLSNIASPKIITKYFKNYKITNLRGKAFAKGFIIYPACYFNPIGLNFNSKPNLTKKTYSIHHYEGSWLPEKKRKWNELMRKKSMNMTEKDFILYIKKPLTRLKKSIYIDGLIKTIAKFIKKNKRSKSVL